VAGAAGLEEPRGSRVSCHEIKTSPMWDEPTRANFGAPHPVRNIACRGRFDALLDARGRSGAVHVFREERTSVGRMLFEGDYPGVEGRSIFRRPTIFVSCIAWGIRRSLVESVTALGLRSASIRALLKAKRFA